MSLQWLRNISFRHTARAVTRYDVLNDDVDLDSSDDISTFANARLEASVISHDESSQHLAAPTTSCCAKIQRIVLTNPLFSIVFIVAVVATVVSLGAYALKPLPDVDRSIKAFSIPNHVVSRRQDALDQAMSRRAKRAVDADDDLSLYLRDLSESFQNAAHAQHSPSEKIVSESIDKYKLRKRISYSQLFEDSALTKDRKLTKNRSRRDWCSLSSQMYLASRIQLVYVARNDDNIFTRDRIKTIHDIESRLILLDDFEDFCYMESFRGNCSCRAINSLLTYLYPSRRADGQWYFDGRGDEMLNINEGIQVAFSRTQYAHWYTDGHINATYYRSTLLRSELQLGLPLKGYTSEMDRREEQMKKIDKFLGTLVSFLSKASTSNVTVLYGGNELFDYQVLRTLRNDVSLASFAVAAIFVLMFILTSFSVWLTICGISTIILSFPLAFFFYRIAFKINAIGILNGVAAFVIIGIGVDDVFVFINTYRQNSHIQDPVLRMTTTIKVATKATFLTSFTTAAAFAANMFSSIPAVHDFGVFMTMIVCSCWLLVVLLIPPVINIWSHWFACCESKCYRCCWKCKLTNHLRVPQDIAHFLSCKPGHDNPTQQPGIEAEDRLLDGSVVDDDVAMLDLDKDYDDDDGENMLNNSDPDDPLVQLEAETRAELREISEGEGMKLIIWLQGIMYHFIALPVIRARWVIIGIYIVILGASIGCMTQLRPTSKPPQLYRPDTNIQMLLDLVANYSKQTLSCDDCSGVYKDGMTYAPVHTSPSATHNIDRSTSSRETSIPQFSSTFSTKSSSLSSTFPTTTMMSTLMTTQSRLTSKTTKYSNESVTRLGLTTTSSSITDLSNPLTSTLSSIAQPGVSSAATKSSSTISTPNILHPLTSILSSIAQPDATTSKTSSSTYSTSPTSILTSASSSTADSNVSSSQSSSTLYISPSVTAAPRITSHTIAKEEFHPCANGKCANIPTHAPLESGTTISVVFGIKDIDRSNVPVNRVLSDKGSVIYDQRFSERMDLSDGFDRSVLRDLCRICMIISNNTKLVKPNSAQCRPAFPTDEMKRLFQSVDACRSVPELYRKGDDWRSSSAKFGVSNNALLWIAFSFESTTYKGQSSFSAYKQYMEWEDFIEQIIKTLPTDSPLSSMYQTSEFWSQVIMEIVAVSSALYSLIFSLIVCIITVTIFTGHFGLMAITIGTMIGMICLVVAIFYILGWEIGAIEAVSLSILVGSSVDYCVHIVEGYILTASALTPQLTQQDNAAIRRWRTKAAITHIGTSVISSALTTIVAAIPLTQTILVPFSRFGTIVAINTTVAIVYSLTVCISLLSVCAPARYINTWKSTLIAVFSTGIILSLCTVILFCVSRYGGIHIPGPNGADLFKVKSG